MKKAVVILLALVLATAVFAGTQPATNKPVVIKMMAYGDNSNQEGQNWVRIVDAFMAANPNITIEYEMLYDEAYHQKVTARLASGDVPHLAYMGADARWGAPWKEAGQQYDHKSVIDADYFDLSLIPPMGPKGEIYEIPLGTSNLCTVLFYNNALGKKLGIAGPPKTYEDLVAMAEKTKAAGIDCVSIDGADGWAWGSCLMSTVIARLSGDSGWVSKAVAGQNKFTDKVFVDSLAMITRMVNDGVLSSKATLVDYGQNVSNFSTEKALLMIQGQWAAGGIDPVVADETTMIAWPKLPGEKAGQTNSVAAAIQVGYGITQAGAKDPAVRKAALAFLTYFNSEPEVTQRLRDGGIVAPILKNYKVPADLPKIIGSKVALAQSVKVITDVIDAYLSGAPNDALNAGMQKIANGSATPEEVAAEVQQLLDAK